ncbi:hypothetical protein HCQ94_00850 [Actinomyces sp. zg-332]|uniref:SHIRT domain-containing protein n=1 Tax=Actinomyces sp. zg-332 TaxID=2708340 RepID=UPI0018C34935|nr:SHIRT domain-containing protein [Actinomyces sp. zg-332]QPK94294.1 hypothetical protein HCQ94_00850 [Actinomyces sp. zg-332]
MRQRVANFLTVLSVVSLILLGIPNVNVSYATTDVSTEAQLRAALSGGETNINITSNFQVTSPIEVSFTSAREVTISSTSGNTITSGDVDSMFRLSGSNTTLKFDNINLDGNNNGRLLRLTDGAKLDFRNGKISNGISWKNGVSDPNSGNSDGGAIYAGVDSTVKFHNTTFENNRGILPNPKPRDGMNGHGGAIYAYHTKLVEIVDSVATNNVSGILSGGGFAYIENSENVTVSGSTFTGNHNNQVTANSNQGGVFHIVNSNFTSSNNTYNVAATFNTGGALYLSGISGNKKATSTNDVYKMENLGDAYGISGGSILSAHSNLEIDNGTFTVSGNSKVIHAGGVIDVVGGGNLSLKNSTLTGRGVGNGNGSATFGGAICFEDGSSATALIENTNISNFHADKTGGMISIGGRFGKPSTASVTIRGGKFHKANTQAWGAPSGDEGQAGGMIYVSKGATLNIEGTTMGNDADGNGGQSPAGGLIYNAGSTTISGGAVLNGGIGLQAGGTIFNDGYLKLDDMTLNDLWRGHFVGGAWWSGIQHPTKGAGEYAGINIYAKKDVIITPRANISTSGDIHVIDGQSAVVLTGTLTKRIDVSISEVAKDHNLYPENAERHVGYVVAKGDGNYEPVKSDANFLHYITRKADDSNPVAAYEDNTSIGKWDYVYNPENKTIVVGQRAKMVYHVNADDAKFDDNSTEKEELYDVYSSTAPWTDPEQMTKISDVPSRTGFAFTGWYYDNVKELICDLNNESEHGDRKFKFEEEKFTDSTAAITGILPTNELHTYAGWITVFNVTHEFVSGTAGKDLPQTIKDKTPANQTDKPNGTKVNPTDNFDKTDVEDTDNDGIWKWTNWDKQEDTINKKDAHFVGTWVFTQNKYNVTHEFVSGTAGKDLPQTIKDKTPANQTDKLNGTKVNPTDNFDKTDVEDTDNDGIWKWTNWDKQEDTINKKDAHFVGTWVFTQNKYNVTHEFVSGTAGKDLPQTIKDKTPANQTDKLNGTKVNPTDNFDKTDVEDADNDGIWKWTNWDKQEDTINKKDAHFVGTWVFTQNKYNVTHEFVSGTAGKDLPQTIKDKTPANQTDKLNGTKVNPTDNFDKTDVEDADNDGIWKWTSWDKQEDTINKKDAHFVGTWVFTQNKYNVTHEFVSGTAGKDLPQTIKDKTPANQTDKLNGTKVNPTDNFDKTDVVVKAENGKWVWKTWDAESKIIDKADAHFIGKWEFVKDPVKPNVVLREKPKKSAKLPETGFDGSVSYSLLSLLIVGFGLVLISAKRKDS